MMRLANADAPVLFTSPSGFQAIAGNRDPDDNADFTDYVFTSPRFWGESAAGTWKVSVLDLKANGVKGSLVNVKIKVFGSAQ